MPNTYIQTLEKHITTVKTTLTDTLPALKQPGLFHGKMGVAMVCYFLYRSTNDSYFKEIADSL